jgi:hypothetical protein
MTDPGIDVQATWFGIAGRMWETPRSPLEGWLGRVSGSPATARALVATPSLFVAWVIASVVVFALGALLGSDIDEPVVPLLAPVIAAIGVSLAYGSAADPAWEITKTMALPERLLLLARVVAVLVTNAVIGVALSLMTGYGGSIVVIWLVPMAAVALVALAATLWSGSSTLGSGIGMVVWMIVLLRDQLTMDRTTPHFSPGLVERSLPLLLVSAALGAVMVFLALSEGRVKGLRR